ncbi:hypothetical protein [Flavobacterium sp. 5]|uniref:hypothetical protein n=1 Tax=Flavobacterium sp. 5 TaxID=2035199 RepID=UPI000C2BB630|nr:hypothetical protein [Flavobacterium sp. 5]PKB15180.1 hypothetical protein CLU82_0243 [Flavobacterium sp. 5]
MKKIFTLAAAATLAFTSCTSDDNEDKSSDSLILPKTVSYIDAYNSEDNSIATVTYNGNKIVQIVDGDSKTEYVYTDDLITKTIDTHDNGDSKYTDIIEYTYIDNKLATEFSTSSSTSNSIVNKYKYKYTYNNDGTILRIGYYFDTDGNEIEGGTTRLTVSNGNVLKSESLNEDETIDRSETHEYDNKNSFFKNILGLDKLYVSEGGEYSTNNEIKFTSSEYPTDDYTITYIYNDNGFPTEAKMYDVDGVLWGTRKFTY